jgi:AbrB family looped-hinge helix DNA binding protein
VQLGAKSRIVLPARVRERLCLAEGDRLILRVHLDNTITLFSRREAARRAYGVFTHVAPGISLA